MKKTILCAVLLLIANITYAQLFKTDPDVRIGKLDNGLTYYIRHNHEPKERAYFYIAQKVGSIQEEESQKGLAHFLEHMSFNGTAHFPGTSLRSYLERIGVKFGADLNAYTATNETVYNIDNVPTKVDGAIDSCLWILHDWSNDLTLDPDEIENERGVIHEEWRMRNTADQRMNEAIMRSIMKDSKYEDAMPIGSMEVVLNFKPETLRDYYEKWYRPDLQGIVVVGDIDVEQIEAKIKKIFSDIPKTPKNAPERVYYRVPDNKEPIYFSGTDKELHSSFVTFYFKHASTPRSNKNEKEYMLKNLFSNFIYGMYHDHTRDIAQKPNSPFGYAFIREGSFFIANDDKALKANVGCLQKRNGIAEGTEAMLRELFRVRKHGFTQTEFDRYRNDMLVSIDNLLNTKDKRSSTKFVNEYVRNFLDNEPIVKIEDEIAFWKSELPKLSVNDLNNYFKSLFNDDDHNMVITVTAPKNDTINVPTKKEMLTLYERVKNEKIEPYVDVVNNLPFLPTEPAPGKIVSEKTKEDGTISMKLSNGVSVIIKKTDLKKNDIMVQALAQGGSSLYPANMYKYSQLMNMMISVSGWGNYNLSDMEKKFSGVTARINAGVSDNYQSVAGDCVSKDIKSLLEMMHASFLYPHKDDNAFKSLCKRLSEGIKESLDKPETAYGDSLQKTLYGESEYTEKLTCDDYMKADYDLLLNLYKERFSDASNFTFTVVGDVDVPAMRPYIEKYIASLPSTYKNEKAKPIKVIKPGTRTCIFEKEQETPKATITIQYVSPGKFTLKNNIITSMLGQILTMKYTRTIREEAGAAYSVGAGCVNNYYPLEQNRIIVKFPTSPEKCDLAVSLVDEGIDDIIKDGPSDEDLDKVKKYLIKIIQSNRTVNEYWQYVMSYEWNHGFSYDLGYEDIVNSITKEDVQKLTKEIKSTGRIMVIMTSPKK